MRADEDVHAVDLMQAEPVEGAAQMALIDSRRPRYAEALRGKRDAPGLGQRDAFDHAAGSACIAIGMPLPRSAGNVQQQLSPFQFGARFDRSEEHTSELESLMRS